MMLNSNNKRGDLVASVHLTDQVISCLNIESMPDEVGLDTPYPHASPVFGLEGVTSPIDLIPSELFSWDIVTNSKHVFVPQLIQRP